MAHAALGIAMKKVPLLATVHAVVTLLVAMVLVFSSKSSGRVVTAVCYIAGSEVLWRMAGASVFWEFGKYAVCTVLFVRLLRHRPSRPNWLAVAYFALLLPSVLLTVLGSSSASWLRQALSFNLSGPFSLALCAFCFYGLRVTPSEALDSLLAIVAPLAGVASACLFGLANLGAGYEFGNESNFDASGGFGPNQVSSVLGLGILAAFLWAQSCRRLSSRWWLAVALLLWFAGQAALTFSRSGVWMGLLTIVIASAFTVTSPRKFWSSVAGAVVALGLFYLLFQALDNYTGGKLGQRYSQKGFSRREDIARGDLTLAMHHPILGVGPGMAKAQRARELGIGGAPHTEMTRLLCEHGASGLLALTALGTMALLVFRRITTAFEKSWTVSLLAYTLLFMMVSGMRLAVPAVTMGLALVRLKHSSARFPWAMERQLSLNRTPISFRRRVRRLSR